MTNGFLTITTYSKYMNYHTYIRHIAELAKIVSKVGYATVYSVDKRFTQNHLQKPIKIAIIIHGEICFVN